MLDSERTAWPLLDLHQDGVYFPSPEDKLWTKTQRLAAGRVYQTIVAPLSSLFIVISDNFAKIKPGQAGFTVCSVLVKFIPLVVLAGPVIRGGEIREVLVARRWCACGCGGSKTSLI